MSAEANKQLMEAIFAEIEAGNGAPFAATLADDVVMRVTGQYSWSRTFTGKEAVMRDLYGYVRSLVERGSRTIPLRIFADGDHVIVEARGAMKTKAGEKYDNEYCLIYRFSGRQDCRDARVLRLGALRARLGLFPASVFFFPILQVIAKIPNQLLMPLNAGSGRCAWIGRIVGQVMLV
jgi:ketosteroid isomerase-like protein